MFEYWMESDLNQLAEIENLPGRVFSQDNEANLIGIRVINGDEEVEIYGDIYANIVKPDGTTITVNGTAEGNRAWVVLPSSAYDTVGKIGIYIRNEFIGQVITLGGVEGFVYPSQEGQIIVEG